MSRAVVYLTKIVHFSAGHRLASPRLTEAENRAVYGPCSRPHGHNYGLEVTVKGAVGDDGMVVDLEALERTIQGAVLDLVDHRDLDGDVPALGGVITTGENLASAFFRLLEAQLPSGTLHRVAVVETSKNRFEYGGDGDRP